MPVNILIQGANGNTGSATVRALLRLNANIVIRAGVRNTDTDLAREWTAKGVDVVECDTNRPETLESAFRNIDKAFICPPNVENRADVTKDLVAAAKAAGVKHLVLLSSLGAQYESILFAKQLRAAERHVEGSGIAWTILRPTFFMDNFYGWAQGIKSGGLYLRLGDGKVGMISVDDIGRTAAYVFLGTGHNGKHYDLTGPRAIGAARMARILSEVTGHKVDYIEPSEQQVRDSLAGMGVAGWQINGYIELFNLFRKRQAEVASPAIYEITGSHPISFRDWLKPRKDAF